MIEPYWYFLYSEQQQESRESIEAKMSRTFVPGYVIVNGSKKKFTEKSTKNTNIYPDVRVIAEGLESRVKYVDISVQSARKKKG